MSLFHILDVFLGWFGYSPAVLLNFTAPRWGYRIERAIPYGPEARHRMDLYLPKRTAQSAPAVLFFYGGAFISGHRCEYRFVGQALASQGIIVGIADYGLFPEHRFPEFVQDGAKASAFLHKLLPERGGDPKRLFVAGHSAGAYIAVMLASNPDYLKETGAGSRVSRAPSGSQGLTISSRSLIRRGSKSSAVLIVWKRSRSTSSTASGRRCCF